MMKRPGSVMVTAISMTAVFLTMIVGTMAFFDSNNRRAQSEKWRDIAEQAARSGLDLVLGWGQANIDAASSLPASWDMADGAVIDPITAYMRTTGAGDAVLWNSNPVAANPGQILGTAGNPVGEYVLSRLGDYIVTIKARVQQYAISSEMPKQYRVGVIGRVRKARNTPGAPGVVPTSLEDGERGPAGNLVAERMVTAHIGKEPFSRYAALVDVDFVQNWVPGELVDGPVHINRGYVDDVAAQNVPVAQRPPADRLRSLMMIHSSGSPLGFATVNGFNYPRFTATVSMTVRNANGLNDNSPANHSRYIQYDQGNYTGQNGSNIFQAPENQNALVSFNGPSRLADNVEMPRSSRSRMGVALGLPSGQRINDTQNNWFNDIPDGVYIPTRRTWTGNLGADQANFFIPSAWRYNQSGTVDDSPAGGIYIRGNVEVMRMSVAGANSYYLLQLGYGGFGLPGAALPSRAYVIRVNRTSRVIDFVGANNQTLAGFFSAELADANLTQAEVDNKIAGIAITNAHPRDFRVGRNNLAVHAQLTPTPATVGFPFNGVIFVDLSAHDPARNPGDATTLVPGQTPLTGNIYALGDPNLPKTTLMGNTAERVATYNGATDTGRASKLTILTAGNVFIQNHLMLETIRTTAGTTNGFAPTQDNFTINNSRDLLGIVSDKQVVVGVRAPSTTTRENVGTVIHAAIAALGDPALQYNNPPTINPAEMVRPLSMRGSFTTEALMTAFPTPQPEQYNILSPTPLPASGVMDTYVADVFSSVGGMCPARWNGVNTTLTNRFRVSTNADGTGQGVFPGTPLAALPMFGYSNTNNPNFTNTRGRLVVFGSVTQKKRGILGVGNRSFDKDIRYDKRLLSIAPPLFPTSTNIVMRTSLPFSPNAQIYRAGSSPTTAQTTVADLSNPYDQTFMARP